MFLTDDELTELQKELPALWQTYVDRLSEYMASTGKQYQNHAATIRRWAAEDRKKAATPETEITAFEKVKPYDGNH